MFRRSNPIKHSDIRKAIEIVLLAALISTAPSLLAETFQYPVLGRLTEKNGKPVDGPVTLLVNFYRVETGGTPLLSLTSNNVPLQEGIFQLSLALTPSDYTQVFSSVTDSVYVEVIDMTHDPNSPYPRMKVGMTAYAGKVPVDGKTVYFDSTGHLAVGPNSSPAAGEFLTKDSSGNFVWLTPSANATAIGGSSISSSAPSAGQVLKFTGGVWTPTTDSGISKTGDTGVGSIALGAQKTLGLGSVDNSTETTLVGTLTVGGDKGKTWFNTDTNQIKYWDGSAAVVVGASGAGLTNLNGQTGNTQTFAINTATGTAPAWSSAANVHTLQIPLASAASVTAGLLSKTDYDSFVAKLDKAGGTMSGSINLGGNDLRNIGNVILGTGDGTGTPVAGTLMGPSGTGTDISGTDLSFDGAKGTGSGGSGGFAFRVAPPGGASGATANTLATAMKLSNAGNLGIGTTSPTAVLHLKAGTATANTAPLKFTSGTNLTTPEAGAVEYDGTNLYYTDGTATRRTIATTNGALTYSGAITMSAAGTGLAVTNNATIGGTLGVTGAATLSGGATIAANQNLNMASGTGIFTQTYTGTTTTASTIVADAVTTASAQDISADGLTSGNILNLTSTSTAAAAGNTGLNIGISGANGTASITRYGIKSSLTATGTTSTNVAGYFSASGATNNYGLIVENGRVGIGTTTPTYDLDVMYSGSTTNTNASVQIAAPNGANSAYLYLAGNRAVNDQNTAAIRVMSGASGSQAEVAGIFFGEDGTAVSNHSIKFLTHDGTSYAERMRISASGSVGIGTTAPGQKFSVVSSDNTASTNISAFYANNLSQAVAIGYQSIKQLGATAPLYIDAGTTGAVSIATNSTGDVLLANGGGNVGIGTTTPGEKLEVNGVGSIYAKVVGTTGQAGVKFGQNTNSSQIFADGTNNFNFYDTGRTTSRMVIDTSGNVGIGTTSPGSLFTVNQAANTTDGTQATHGIALYNQGVAALTLGSDASYNYLQSWAVKPLKINSQGNNTLINPTSGSVGIGTTSPTAVLHLKAGTATASTAPLKLTSGTNLTTPEAGAIEYDGTNLYYTDGTATRRTLSTTSGATTYTGAVTMGAAGTGLAVTNNATVGGTLGVTGAATFSGGASVAANQNLSMASGTGTFTQTYTGTTTSAHTTTADSVTTASVESVSANGLTSGNILSLSSSSTAAAAGNTGLNIAISGANATSSITRYGMQSAVTATGTTSTNVAGYFSASGGTNNYGLIVANGNVGIGTTSPPSLFSVGSPSVFRVDSTGAVGLGQAPVTTAAIGLTQDYTDPSATSFGIRLTSITNSITADNAQVIAGISSAVRLNQNGFNATATGNSIRGIDTATYGSGASGTISGVAGVYALVGNLGAGTVSTASAVYVPAVLNSGGGTITYNQGVYVAPQTVGTNIYGIRSSIASTANRYNLYIDGTADNYIAGNVGIGTTSPSRPLHVTGSGIASTAVATATATIAIAGDANVLGTTSFDLQQDPNYAYVWNRDNTPLVFGTNGATRMTIDATGNVGIGATAPAVPLEVRSAGGTDQFRVSNSNGNGYLYAFSTAGTSASIGAYGTSQLPLLINQNGGNVGIGTSSPAVALQVAGDIRVGLSGTNGCVQQFAGTALTGTCSSDARLKKDIKALGPVLDRLSLIEPSTYRWRADEFPERHYGEGLQLGVIAQQVRDHMPELVEEDKDGYLKVHFGDLPIYLLAGLRELKSEKDTEIGQLKAENAQLRADSKAKDGEIEQLRAFLCTKFSDAPMCGH